MKLIGTSALDLPDLADLWFRDARGALNRRLASYVERRAEAGFFRPMPDRLATARFVTETASWFAVHRHWEPYPDAMSDEDAAATVRTAVCRSLLLPGETT